MRRIIIIVDIDNMHTFHTGTPEQIYTVGKAVEVSEHNTSYTSLNNELGTLEAWRGGDIYSGAFAGIITASDLGYSVCLGMEHIGLCCTRQILTYILEAYGSTVEAVGYYHLVLYHNGTDLPTLTV